MIDVITLASTFLASVIGLVGHTWDSKAKGIHKLTVTGKALFMIAVVAMISATYQIQEKNRKIATRDQISTVAYGKILYNLNENLLATSLSLVDELSQGKSSVNTIKYYTDDYYMLSTMKDNLEIKFGAKQVLLTSKPQHITVGLIHKDMAWWEIFHYDFLRAKKEIEMTLAQYASYLEPDVVLEVSNLLRSDAFVEITEMLPALMKEPDKVGEYPIRTSELLGVYFFPHDKPSMFERISKIKMQIDNARKKL